MAAEFVGGDETVTKIEALIARDSVESAERIADIEVIDAIVNRYLMWRDSDRTEEE